MSMGFSRPEYWSGLPFPPLGDLPNPGIGLVSLVSPALPLVPSGKPQDLYIFIYTVYIYIWYIYIENIYMCIYVEYMCVYIYRIYMCVYIEYVCVCVCVCVCV